MAQTRWGDEDDDSASSVEEEQIITTASGHVIPPTHSTRVDSKGIKTVTSYKPHSSNMNQIVQTTSKIRVVPVKVREHISVDVRRKWKKFGHAADQEDQSNVTIISREDIFMEDPHVDNDLQDEDVSKSLAGNLNAFWTKQQRRNLERKYEAQEGPEEKVDEQGWTRVGGTLNTTTPSSGKYVPPSLRGTGTGAGKTLGERDSHRSSIGGDRDHNTIRVTNISEDTTEADLQELFSNFGRISRVYLAKDKETLQSRGFAFVSFIHRDDAARAMEKLQGYGYDHLILKLEWARPSAPRDPGSEGTQFRSGYGKALAQDTKEKVSYASNLTRGMK